MRASRPSGSDTIARARPGHPRAGACSRPGSPTPRWRDQGADGCSSAGAAREAPRRWRTELLIAPYRRLAGAAVEDGAVGILRPLRAAGPALRLARERTRPPAGGRAGLLAVLRRDAD